ncbi:very-long-chain 3-oxoacyl-CoA reductase-like [Adelges cooleyi]|uniref:very-long-chain 3-oxoacyl-CoA reductase-like n=1 Tax=Adelges cooleyi TaxID=133065 RepID=UPI00217FDA7B|nr:very-long-chain 3-oxoacyl-CoA reductase-like [Adelges cooleyi]
MLDWPKGTSYLEVVGIVGLCLWLLKLTVVASKSVYQNLLAPLMGRGVDFKKTGQWAVITGATDGIGREYAEQLAAKGMDVVLVSRTKSKLENTSNDIKSKYGVDTKIIETDFTDHDPELTDRLAKEMGDLDIGVLVNNVGVYNPYPDYFLNFDKNNPLYDNMVKCNISPVVHMCRAVMPGMVKRNRGVVINISSAAAVIHCPLLTVYGATKTFVEKFSVELAKEYENDGILVQCVLPYFVATESNNILNRPSWLVPTAKTYVRSAIKTTGIQSITTGYFPHTIVVYTVKLLDSICHPLVSAISMKLLLRCRNRYMRRYSEMSQV